MHEKKALVVLICIALAVCQEALGAKKKKRAKVPQGTTVVEQGVSSQFEVDDASGRLIYTKDRKGNRLIDFSHVGYHSGEKAIPDVPVKITLEPGKGDDTTRIQAALDKLGTLPLNAARHRGALLLKLGVYRVNGTLTISHSGVVLRGEGDGPNGTTIVATGYDDPSYMRTLISVGTSTPLEIRQESGQQITDAYVPVGTRSFRVASAKQYAVGDDIVVYRPSTAEWIHSIGCDQLVHRYTQMSSSRWVREGAGESAGFYYFRDGRATEISILKKESETWDEFKSRIPLNEDRTKIDNVRQWQPGEYDFYFERTITAIDDNRITIDAPIVHSMEVRFGGGSIYHFETPGRIREMGIEHLRLISEFDKPVAGQPYGDPKSTIWAENHAWHGIVLEKNTENSWVRNVTGNYFGWSLVSARGKRATVQDCLNLGHASKITGGRRYSFMIDGQLNLMQRCITFEGRHEFVNQARVPGPNVFVDCVAPDSRHQSGPHHRYAVGNLYDNVKATEPLQNIFRYNYGSGHGWPGAQICFYNCVAPRIRLETPPGAINWNLGSGPEVDPSIRLKPASLYYQQVLDRLGQEALNRLATEEQQQQVGKYLWVPERLRKRVR